MLTLFLFLPPHLFQPCSGSFFSPPPGPISYLPIIFHPSTPLLSLFALASPPPHLARSWSDRPPGQRPHPPAATARMRFPPVPGGPKEFLARAYAFLSPSGCPPFDVLDLRPGPCRPQGSPVRGSLPPFSCLPQPHPPPLSPAGLYRRPSPLPVPSGGVVIFFPPSPVHPPRSLRFISRRLLVSSEVFDFLSGVRLLSLGASTP